MESDTSSAPWHPAMRPNTMADDKPAEIDPEAGADNHLEQPTESSAANAVTATAQEELLYNKTAESVDEHIPTPDEFPVDTSSHAPELDPIEHGEGSGAISWATEALEAPNDAEAAVQHNDEATTTDSDPAPTDNASKHMSTSSFTRTVPHEMSFNDDEDAEWNLQRSETEPFGFLLENQRTNSFPAVPETGNSVEEEHSYPPPTNQVGEIMQDLEAEIAHDDDVAFKTRISEESVVEQVNGHEGETTLFQNLVGGELVGTEEEVSDARFEEGLPLISQHDSLDTVTDTDKPSEDPANFFIQDEADEAADDFFFQAQSDSQLPIELPLDRTLQRKSTSMVIGQNVDSEPLSPAEDLQPETFDVNNMSTNGDSIHSQEGGAKVTDGAEDIDAKWAAAFGDDDGDDFLLENTTEPKKELDPADIFGSDDEGFLDDEEPTPGAPSQIAAPQSGTNGHYGARSPLQQPYSPLNPYAPPLPVAQIPGAQQLYGTNVTPMGTGYGAPPPRPNVPKAQSFVDKSKGGYQSPYDLPMEVVKPRRRVSAQQTPRANATSLGLTTAPPPRSVSVHSQPPSGGSVPSLSPTGSGHSNQPLNSGAPKLTPQLKSKPSFFEDLPVASKPRPLSRQTSNPSPTQPSYPAQLHAPPQGPPMGSPLIPPPVAFPQSQPQLSPTHTPNVDTLVIPDRVSPYASLQPDAHSAPPTPSTANSRYSPAPPGANGLASPQIPAVNRYSPAPPNARSSGGSYSAVPPPMLAHQPRTSSPLAHFEISRSKSENKLGSPITENNAPLVRSSSSQYEHRVTRIPSLPPTQEVEEEQSLDSPSNAPPKGLGIVPPEPRYALAEPRRTPPPLGIPPSNPLSPPKRSLSNYTPQNASKPPSKEVNFVPPPRSQTQSPGAASSHRGVSKSTDSAPRPSSAHGPMSPQSVPGAHTSRPTVRTRGMSQSLNLVPPTDGRELDPLHRWHGAPSIAWGIGGLFVTTYPKDVPRYGISSSVPQIIRSPGEVKIKHMRDLQPLEDRLSKFPGPLKGKSKKKDVGVWLSVGIEGLEGALPNVAFQQYVSHEDKRAVERVLLWKVLRVLVEHEGVLEGNPTVEKAVRDVISPGLESASAEAAPTIATGVDLTGAATIAVAMPADGADSAASESIRMHLLLGEREKAVWTAVDKRMWGHAILISSSMPNQELYKQVAHEFIKKEVNHAGHGNESLASLYSVLSGNFEEAVDELVPAHARAGLQLMSTSASATSQDVLAGLDKWRETLGMILSNRRQGDGQALRSLGDLLSGYGRAEAAHICYIFARHFSVFGGLDDPNAHFVLVGADHRRQADQFAKETEALQLSEVYEYGLSLASGSNVPQSCPHLAAYKLQHAMVLAEHGFRDKALQYCEGIWGAITSQTKKSPYFNPILESAVDDLMRRLKQAAGEESSSWIPKPKMDQVSSNMWSRFSKFVAGPDDDRADNAVTGEGGIEIGPFARIAGGTPTVSRSPSVSNFEVYGASPPMPINRASSAYAPIAAQPTASPYEPSSSYNPAPRSSMERTSGELRRGSYEFARRGSDIQSVNGSPYTPASTRELPKAMRYVHPESPDYVLPSQSHPQAIIPEQPSNVGYQGYQPFGGDQGTEGASVASPYGTPNTASHEQALDSDSGFGARYQPFGSYEPSSMNSFNAVTAQTDEPTGAYEPPSYQPSSFEAPSYEPGPVDEAESEKPKKSSFMDDDDDTLGLASKGKTKSEKDRENEEMFRKVAEEEAKREAEAKNAKKAGGWGFGGWFGGSKKEAAAELPNKPIKAKLGEASSFVYDPDLKRWVNKKPGAENTPSKTATPPPPRAASTPPTSAVPGSPMGAVAPPPRPTPPPMSLNKAISQESLNAPGGAPLMARSISNQSNASVPPGVPSAPPSRPATSLSNASSIDDLLGAAGPRKGPKKARKSGRYVDVMAK